MKKIFYLLLPFLLLSCGNNSNKNSNSSSESEDKSAYYADIAIEGYNTGYEHGANDGWNDSYNSSFTLSSKYLFDEERTNYETGYRKGYNEGYNAGKAAYKEELAKRVEAAEQVLAEYENSNVTVTASSTPNTYSTPTLNSYTIHSDESIYGDYYNYKETNNCEEGAVVYEGKSGHYIIETRKGYTVIEDYSGTLYEGAMVRGELNQYNFKYLINRNRNEEIKVYVEDYMLSDERALELLGKQKCLKVADQRGYDANNN